MVVSWLFSFLLHLHFSTSRIALELPDTAGSEAGSGAECILHELHIGDFPVLEAEEDSERGTDLLPQFSRRVSKIAEDRDVFSLAQDNLQRFYNLLWVFGR
jgi:hypothetical protein